MSLSSRFNGQSARKKFTNSLKPWLACASLLTIQQAASAQDNSATNATPAELAPPVADAGTNATLMRIPTVRRNKISVSGDYSFEDGKITLPIGYSLSASLSGFHPPAPVVATPKRSSDYYGGTISYSHGERWFFDASYAHGDSTGTQNIGFNPYGSGSGPFTLDDDWYQAYVRYAFPNFGPRKKFTAYVRAGATYVDATLKYGTTSPAAVAGSYSQTDDTTDIYGNIGMGLTYAFYTHGRLSIGLQGELEGLGGERSQKSLEQYTPDAGLVPVTAHIDNTVYGGVGRATLHLDYRVGKSGRCHVFLDGGAQYQYLEVSYPGAGDQSETLYGPYVKLGLRYSF